MKRENSEDTSKMRSVGILHEMSHMDPEILFVGNKMKYKHFFLPEFMRATCVDTYKYAMFQSTFCYYGKKIIFIFH